MAAFAAAVVCFVAAEPPVFYQKVVSAVEVCLDLLVQAQDRYIQMEKAHS